MPNMLDDIRKKKAALKQAAAFADAPAARVKKKDRQGIMDGYTQPKKRKPAY